MQMIHKNSILLNNKYTLYYNNYHNYHNNIYLLSSIHIYHNH